jgi:hypothetical protein
VVNADDFADVGGVFCGGDEVVEDGAEVSGARADVEDPCARFDEGQKVLEGVGMLWPVRVKCVIRLRCFERTMCGAEIVAPLPIVLRRKRGSEMRSEGCWVCRDLNALGSVLVGVRECSDRGGDKVGSVNFAHGLGEIRMR